MAADGEDYFDKKRQTCFHLDPEKAEQIMQVFGEIFSNLGDVIVMACDAGCWGLVLENEEGKRFRWSGSLLDEAFPGEQMRCQIWCGRRPGSEISLS